MRDFTCKDADKGRVKEVAGASAQQEEEDKQEEEVLITVGGFHL
jgi:hypothetical protein